MPTITAQSIVDKAEEILLDTGNVRWSAAELLRYLNDGQRAIVTLRPDAYTKVTARSLSAGTAQTLPSDGLLLMRVPRNMGTAGTTPGRAVRQSRIDELDRVYPDWHTATQTTVVEHYLYDPRHPKRFYVYPPSDGTGYVEVVYSASPPDVAALGDVITLDDVYVGPLLDYVLYRSFSKDTEITGTGARAAAHYQAFVAGLGMKTQGDSAIAGAAA